MKNFYVFFIALLFIISSSCKKEKSPIERIELSNSSYRVNCLNCKPYYVNGTMVDFNSIRTTFKYSSKKASIGSDSYLKVIWTFSDGSKGDYLIDYNDLIVDLSTKTISFDGSWAWSYTNNLHLDLILYSGQGSKSNALGLEIPKPAGANRISYNPNSINSLSQGPASGGIIR